VYLYSAHVPSHQEFYLPQNFTSGKENTLEKEYREWVAAFSLPPKQPDK
jgi:hypothetical protein